MTVEPKIVDRIRKLLSLSRSSNSYEAAIAAARAADLMAKYELEEAQIRLEESKPSEPIVEKPLEEKRAYRKRRVAWKGAISKGLADAFGVKFYWMDCELQLFGRPSAISAVQYMYAYLVKEVEELVKAEAGKGKAYINAFKVGAASNIARRLRDRRREELKDRASKVLIVPKNITTALVLVQKDETELEEAYVELGKRLQFVRTGPLGQFTNESGYCKGREAGARVNIHGGKGLSSPPKQLRR